VVFRILNACVLEFVLGLWSGHSDFMAVFMVLICRLVQVLFLSHIGNCLFSDSRFPVTTHGPDLFSGAYLNKLLCLWYALVENISV